MTQSPRHRAVADGAWPALRQPPRRRRAGGPRRCPSGCAPGGSPGHEPPFAAVTESGNRRRVGGRRTEHRTGSQGPERGASSRTQLVAHGRGAPKGTWPRRRTHRRTSKWWASKNRTCDLSIIRAVAPRLPDRVNESGSNLAVEMVGWPDCARRIAVFARRAAIVLANAQVYGMPEADRAMRARATIDYAVGIQMAGGRQSPRRRSSPSPGLPSREAPDIAGHPRTQKNLMARRKDRAFLPKGTCVPVREEEPESTARRRLGVGAGQTQSRREDTQTRVEV